MFSIVSVYLFLHPKTIWESNVTFLLIELELSLRFINVVEKVCPVRCLSVFFFLSFICNTKRPSVKQSMKWQVSSNFGRWTYFGWCPPPPLPLPPFETAWQKSDSYAFAYHQWEPIWNHQLIRKYQYIYKDIDTKGWCPPPIWNCLMKKWHLHIYIQSMRAHSKQSTYKKI